MKFFFGFFIYLFIFFVRQVLSHFFSPFQKELLVLLLLSSQKTDAMRSSALLSSRSPAGGATPVVRPTAAAAAAGRRFSVLRQRRPQRRPHSSSTPAIWDRWGTNKNPSSADASTETEASLVEAVGEQWRTGEKK